MTFKMCLIELTSRTLHWIIFLDLTIVRNVVDCQASLKPLFRIDVVKIYERVPLEKVPRFW